MKLQVTYTFEYTPYLYTDENLTPEQVARRDEDAFNCGDLSFEDCENYQATGLTVDPVEDDAGV